MRARRPRVQRLAARGVKPGLAAVQFGDNPASRVYVRNKMRACAEAGAALGGARLPADCPEAPALAIIDELNADPAVHGILVQLPLPAHLDAHRITQAILPGEGRGRLQLGESRRADRRPRRLFEPCTPRGVVVLLDRAGVAVEGRHAVIVGRSNIVGKPLALMLINRGATVTVCHTRTRRSRAPHARRPTSSSRRRDARGSSPPTWSSPARPSSTSASTATPTASSRATWISSDVREVAGWITPVPGGVGPMTVAMLIANTVLRGGARRR